ncbi:MAG: hypothetical protein D6729_00875 [Deltaproteobacteria bacterium]|nr:MAG: hypothetical protein D6729_00875 [Deltaproteobacteria bacterium]
MSLKAFHVFFVSVALVFCIGMGVWAAVAWKAHGGGLELALSAGSVAAAIALAVYGRWMLKKLAKESYL